ncbi:putative alcohol dehydrogenase superfamily zinc-containing [Diplodia seriata]|uniref:Putative alcohol dehydrogenase superfamily zinc-containing n=1 Tax=Diplodia seriata TaxID=420778 RepID=A0A0G2E1L6_9PEZI|nr:putative alcohol dehydrogenase superfamily zinc-containing [Diplodia seriata]
MMRGVVYNGVPYQVNVTDLPVPTLSGAGNDAVVRLTHAAICGSDLHMYHGVQGAAAAPWTMGHEGVGYIAELGDAVTSLAVGDYVVIPDTLGAGHLEMDPGAEELLAYGSGNEELGGLQAEYAHIPNAELNLIPATQLTQQSRNGSTNATLELDYVTTSDIFATGWTALSFASLSPGDTVAVFGAGPVGLLAAYSALLRGASRVYSIDCVPARLSRAAAIGAVPIDFSASDPVAQILAREPNGVRRAVDCVGMEAVSANGTLDPAIVTRQMVAVTGAQGGIGQIGVWMAQNATAAAPNANEIDPDVAFPLSDFFTKGLSFRSGVVDPKERAPELVRLIEDGKASPASVIETAVIGIEEAPEYYRRFDRHEEIKVFIRFP